MGFELPKIVAELSESICVGRAVEGGEDGLMDVDGPPSTELRVSGLMHEDLIG